MTPEERKAYEWALNQSFQSVAASYARTLAKFIQNNSTIPRATVADKPFNPDWSLPEAAAESLREHMALVKAAQEREQQFRATVAAALRELRVKFHEKKIEMKNSLYSDPSCEAESDYNERGRGAISGMQGCINELDATIAALGLTEETL